MIDFYSTRFDKLSLGEFDLDFSQIDRSLVYDKLFQHIPHHNILLIGEAPGHNETIKGVPFCGQAGKNLDNLIALSGIHRKFFCITNGFCFRTYKSGSKGIINRTPNSKELKAGSILLAEELQLIKPKTIILLGQSALKAFLYLDDSNITTAIKNIERNRLIKTKSNLLGYEIDIAHTFHPSPLVYNQKAKREQLEQFFIKLGKC